jgi:hypothetical protein
LSPAESIAVDLLLLSLFAIPHSVMARPSFNRMRYTTRFPALDAARNRTPDAAGRSLADHARESSYFLLACFLLSCWQYSRFWDRCASPG